MTIKVKNTPEKIMDVAQKLILREGFHGVSVDKIIEQAGVSKGTFFYHFKSKDTLAVTLLKRFLGEVNTYIEALEYESRTQAQDPAGIFFYFLEHFPQKFYQYTGVDGCLLNAFAYQLAQEIPEIHEICLGAVKGWKQFFTPMIERALEQYDAPKAMAEDFASMMFCLMEGAVICDRIDPSDALIRQFAMFAEYFRLVTIKYERESDRQFSGDQH
ncbi:putative HTH-type transcriptional regulator YxaF [Thalassocella blandensis]|nr:putative HTH-type transcriptional regulator YxaF [Thalassocella blandensis]